MATQSLGVRTSSGTAAAAAAELFTTATQRVRVTEISIYVVAATGSIFGIGFPAAIGITPTTPVALQVHDNPANAGTAKVAVAWGTGPTVPAAFLYRVGIAGVIGTGTTLKFPQGIVIPVSSSLVVWNIGTNSLCDVNFTVTTNDPQALVAAL